MNPGNVCVRVPKSFEEERIYIANVIFNEFIGINYSVVIDESLTDRYLVEVGRGTIILEDDFFSRTTEERGYLSENFFPTQVDFIDDHFIAEEDVVLLYGTGGISVEPDRILCGHDIFSSVFYMLSRWEEAVITETDYLERFPAKRAMAVKQNFLHRPVVNEWISMLENMMRHLDPAIKFEPRQSFRINYTHDIDFLTAPVSPREFARDVIKRKSAAAISKRIGYLVKRNNPYDVFDYFMDVSEKNNSVSRFYFMTGHNVTGKDGQNYNNSTFYKKILRRIRERGHVVGFHPSLLSYNDPVMFIKEKRLLERDLGEGVNEGRQHALRFKMPATWKMWDKYGMKTDSTLGYSAREGFRCGTGNSFSTFDVISRKPLALKEMPLVVMDTTLHVNRKLTLSQSRDIIRQYIETGIKYRMPITLLFHNSIDEEIDWNGWKMLYDELFVPGR